MKNAKFNIICAVFGFLLSFLLGLIAGVPFGHVVLRAFIFGGVFAAVSVGLQFLVKSILATPNDQSDSSAESAPKSGSVVNIVLPEEELATESDAPNFFVGNNHQMLKESDYMHSVDKSFDPNKVSGGVLNSAQPKGPQQPMPEAVAAVAEAAPQKFGDSVQEAELKEAVKGPAAPPQNPQGFQAASLENVAQSAVNPGPAAAAHSGGELDELPNLVEFNMGNRSAEAAGDADEVVEDSDFSNEGKPAAPRGKAKTPELNDKDTVLMAKAISTVLANDNV